MNNPSKTIYVTAATASVATGLCLTAIYQHINTENLPAGKMPGFKEWLIAKEDLQAFIAARAKGEFTHRWKTAGAAKARKQAIIETFHGEKTLVSNRGFDSRVRPSRTLTIKGEKA